jgi:hypothetical protein
MATVVFTAAINSTAKTITLTVSDWDSIATIGDPAYLYYKAPGDSDYTSLGDPITTAPGTIPIYSSGGSITVAGAEDDVIPDGVYEFKLSASAVAPETTDTSVYIFTDAQRKCCLASKIASIMDYSCSDCAREKAISNLTFMKMLLEGAEHDGSTNCGDWTEAQAKLDYVEEFCDDDGDCYQSGCQ